MRECTGVTRAAPRARYAGLTRRDAACEDAAVPQQPSAEQIRELMPFAALIGAELVDATAEVVHGRIEWAPERCTAGGLLHGGALMALADGAGAALAFLNLPEGAIGTATIESKTNFLRGVREGVVTSTSRPLHRGRTTMVIETELAREDGALVAKVTQTQAFHYPR
jgi:1,4-dihydroxy-2-naphthoyl-CoA hydrolase